MCRNLEVHPNRLALEQLKQRIDVHPVCTQDVRHLGEDRLRRQHRGTHLLHQRDGPRVIWVVAVEIGDERLLRLPFQNEAFFTVDFHIELVNNSPGINVLSKPSRKCSLFDSSFPTNIAGSGGVSLMPYNTNPLFRRNIGMSARISSRNNSAGRGTSGRQSTNNKKHSAFVRGNEFQTPPRANSSVIGKQEISARN